MVFETRVPGVDSCQRFVSSSGRRLKTNKLLLVTDDGYRNTAAHDKPKVNTWRAKTGGGGERERALVSERERFERVRDCEGEICE